MTVRRRVWGHRRGWLAALALAVVAGVIVAAVLAAGSPSPTTAAGAAKTSSGAATVRRRNLVQTDTEAGTLSYAHPQTVYDRLSGTVTWLPSVGQVIQPGGVLYRVNGAPVLLMNGNTPAYRTLSAADSDGADVLELNRNLKNLGFNADGIIADDVWQPGTTLGVELLQESLGETATGSLTLGHVVFLPGPQLISTVQGTLGATDNGGSSGQPASGSADPPAPQFVSLESSSGSTTTTTATTTTTTTPTTSTTTSTTPTTTTPSSSPPPQKRHRKHGHGSQPPSLAALLALLRAEEAQLRAQAAQLRAEQQQGAHGNSPSSSNASSGGGNKGSSGTNKGSSGSNGGSNGGSSGGGNGSADGSSGQAILQTTSTDLVVTVDLDASLQSEAKVGERVTVQMPAGNIVNAKVTAVSSVATSSSNSSDNSGGGGGGGNGGGGGGGGGSGGGGGGNGSGSSSTIPVTVTLAGRHTGAGLDEAAVSVNFAQRRARHVLSVPVTALLAVSGGNYAVQEAAAPHARIPVTVGLFAAGYVQISGPGIYPGLQVTDSQG